MRVQGKGEQMTNQEIRECLENIRVNIRGQREWCSIRDIEAIVAAIAAFADPPEGAVKVRAAVAMTPDGDKWTVYGTSVDSDAEMIEKCKDFEAYDDPESPVAFIEAYTIPPRVETVRAKVEGV